MIDLLEVDDRRLRVKLQKRANEIFKLLNHIHFDEVIDAQLDEKQVCLLWYVFAYSVSFQ